MKQLEIETTSTMPWHQLSLTEIVQHLESNLDQGLTGAELPQRQKKYGFNEIQGKTGKSPLVRFLMEFNQPLIYILLIAGIVTLLLKDWVDATVIFGVTIINATIGFIQESKAENAIAALARSVTTEAIAIRDGKKVRLNSRDLVPGDIVLLASGDKVPADLRLVTVRDLQVSESALTGESLPVLKTVATLTEDTGLGDRTNMAYAGSFVTFGRGKGIVVAIANETETGRISRMIEESISLETPLTRKIEKFSRKLLYIILGLATLTFAVVIGQQGTGEDAFKAAVALAVSAIPEGLPAVVTVTLAIGVSRMAGRNAIVRKLPAVETLGSTTVICSDKTGTLTENQMTVQQLYAGGLVYTVTGVGYQPEGTICENQQPVNLADHPTLQECLQCGLLCNDSHLESQADLITVAGDPTEGALIVAAAKAGLHLSHLAPHWPRLDTIPFESQFQYMATLHAREAEHHTIYIKGSLEAILPRCQQQVDRHGQLLDLDWPQIETIAHQMAAGGLRVLAFAQKQITKTKTDIDHSDIDRGLLFLGLQGMIDPPRPEAIAAVRACQSAGIQVKMITGDHALTAAAIADQLGLNREEKAPVFTGQQLTTMTKEEFKAAVQASAVFARVAPEQKLGLVEALQSHGEIVAMTGDGVNDAPALKQADIGVAMGLAGTEVAKEAADMVLTDDNFASIESAVEEGRTVYSNLLKTIGFILPVNGGEALTILGGILAATALPILPVQILWVNMVSSVALSATLAFEPKSRDTMTQVPRPPHQPLLSGRLLWRVVIISLCNLIAVFGMFEGIWRGTGNLALARTMAVHTLVAAESFYLLSISQFIPSFWRWCRHRSSAIAYVPAIGILCVLILQIFFSQFPPINPLFSTVPLTFNQALLCVGAGFPVVIPALLLKRFAPLN
jgi:Ca2+-transporting ATPase